MITFTLRSNKIVRSFMSRMHDRSCTCRFAEQMLFFMEGTRALLEAYVSMIAYSPMTRTHEVHCQDCAAHVGDLANLSLAHGNEGEKMYGKLAGHGSQLRVVYFEMPRFGISLLGNLRLITSSIFIMVAMLTWARSKLCIPCVYTIDYACMIFFWPWHIFSQF